MKLKNKEKSKILTAVILFFGFLITAIIVVNTAIWNYYRYQGVTTTAGIIYLGIILEIIFIFAAALFMYFISFKQARIIQSGLKKMQQDGQYKFPELLGSWNDVSQCLNKMAKSLTGTISMMDQLIKDLPVAVVAVNSSGKVIISNHLAKQLFYYQDSLSACSCITKLLDRTIHKEKPIKDYNYQIKTAADENKQLMINTEVIRGADGSCCGAVLIAYDVTEHKQLLDQMQQAEKLSMITELATGIAHEIKNPLTTSRGLMQILENRFDKKDIARQHIKVAIDEMEHINLIINELESLSQQNTTNLSFSQIEKVLDDISLLLDGQAVCKNITVEKYYQPDLPLAVIDVVQMKQVFLNLGVNALNSMSDGGRLIITAAFNANSNEFEISFNDNGSGISKEHINKIFNPFYTTAEDSTGLGLTVCYQIVKRHGGRIEVQSQKNKGSVFTVYLPAVNN